jgi:hypothetical protein
VIKGTKGTPEKREQPLPYPGLKAIPEILGHKEFKESPAKLEQRAQLAQPERLGQKATKEIPGTLGLPAQLVRLEQPGQRGHKATKAFRVSKGKSGRLGLSVRQVRPGQLERKE